LDIVDIFATQETLITNLKARVPTTRVLIQIIIFWKMASQENLLFSVYMVAE
jgi:hypothetical protein